MCIVCNTGALDASFTFLDAFHGAQVEMEKAAAAMLKCSVVAGDPNVRDRYDRVHKQMRQIIRDWNTLEHTRERTCANPRAAGTPAQEPS